MKQFIVAVLLLVLSVLCAAQKSETEYQLLFMEWMSQHSKVYSTAENFDISFLTFKKNYDMIEAHNGNPSNTYTLACNEYCDWTWEQFKAYYNLDSTEAPQLCSATAKQTRGKPKSKLQGKTLPEAIDWRDKGIITPVKNQGRCGSCWSFSSTGCMEAWHAIASGNLTSLSEQQLLDCTSNFDNHGCNGGLPSHSFEAVNYLGGIMSERDYPYVGVEGKCKFSPSSVVAKFKGSNNITEGDESQIYHVVGSTGPVSIAYQVVNDFMFYKNGVYSSTRCKSGAMDVNHAVLVVGYNVSANNEPYWIIKNSWGASWGQNGYFWMIRGKNMCGIATCASYPQI